MPPDTWVRERYKVGITMAKVLALSQVADWMGMQDCKLKPPLPHIPGITESDRDKHLIREGQKMKTGDHKPE